MNDFLNKIIWGNCQNVLKEIPDNFIDLTITSPPWDNLRYYENKMIFNWDVFKDIAHELYRITKGGGVVVWHVADETVNGAETGTSFRQVLYFIDEVKFRLHDTMIFYVPNMMGRYPTKVRYAQSFQYMFVFSKGKPKTVNLLKRNPVDKSKPDLYYIKKRGRDGKMKIAKVVKKNDVILDNVWVFYTGKNLNTKDTEAFQHPSIFHEKEIEMHIHTWSKEGDIILDPFCGSGTVPKIAIKMNRQFIGIDIVKEYCEISLSRIQKISNLLYYSYDKNFQILNRMENK